MVFGGEVYSPFRISFLILIYTILISHTTLKYREKNLQGDWWRIWQNLACVWADSREKAFWQVQFCWKRQSCSLYNLYPYPCHPLWATWSGFGWVAKPVHIMYFGSSTRRPIQTGSDNLWSALVHTNLFIMPFIITQFGIQLSLTMDHKNIKFTKKSIHFYT